MKKRTLFETALVRRIPKKSDFLRYAAYEMNLEQLRRKRKERLSMSFTMFRIPDNATDSFAPFFVFVSQNWKRQRRPYQITPLSADNSRYLNVR